MFVGAGKVGTVVKTTLKGRECFIRPVRSPDAENKGFINTPYGHLYEPSTKADPQVAARSAACSRIGQQMARLSGLLSPTFDCQIVADSDNPDSVSVVMTSAGDKSMHEAKKSQIPVTENMLQSSLMVQILHRITGQLDGHSENVMFDSKTGHLCAIDPGMTFPPFALGSNCGQLIQNMAARYRAVAPGWENTSQEAAENFIKGKEKTFFRGILPELPPLTERMKAMLRQMTTDPERAQLLKELEDSGKFTSQELAMTEERLDVLAQQIDTVPTVPEGGYLELWSQPNSPFTTENCWLRRLYEGKM
jgi:hypothetical protein